jgi:hypothetical protein
MDRLIIFLVRKRLGIKKFQYFKFQNQKDPLNRYYFTEHNIMKECGNGYIRQSNVSLNWLLDPKCKIYIVEED